MAATITSTMCIVAVPNTRGSAKATLDVFSEALAARGGHDVARTYLGAAVAAWQAAGAQCAPALPWANLHGTRMLGIGRLAA
jgi:hypothetical protein